jgi:hypothetical protein
VEFFRFLKSSFSKVIKVISGNTCIFTIAVPLLCFYFAKAQRLKQKARAKVTNRYHFDH